MFNRYEIKQEKIEIKIEQLSAKVIVEKNATLVIVNTIDDSKDLYNIFIEDLGQENVLLLNTHFTPNDRKKKIATAKDKLNKGEKIVLVSTQLIEAGVDIDFPVLYGDMAIIPSIIQSAGRCNRNGKLGNNGKVILFNLNNRNKNRAELIYRGNDKILLKKTKQFVHKETYSENSLFKTQKKFFNFLGTDLVFGEHIQNQPKAELNFTKLINELAFETIGKFKLIDNDFYGEEFRCYVPLDENDNSFEELLILDNEFKNKCSSDKKVFIDIMHAKYKIQSLLKKMSNQIVQVRLKKNDVKPLFLNNYNDLYLIDLSPYDKQLGLLLTNENQFI